VNIAPRDYQEFVEQYQKQVNLTVRKHGFYGPEAEDLCQNIFLQFIEGDYLKVYDPGTSKFNTFLHRFIYVRIMGRRTKNSRDRVKHALRIAETIEEPGQGAISVDILPVTSDSIEEQTVHSELVGEKLDAYERFMGKLEVRDRLGALGEGVKWKTIMDMFRMKKTRKEICKVIGRSEAWLSIRLSEIKELPQYQEFVALSREV